MASLKQTILEAQAEARGGKAFVQRIADGGFSLRVQRTDGAREARIVTHVWHRAAPGEKSRLLTKAEWLALINA